MSGKKNVKKFEDNLLNFNILKEENLIKFVKYPSGENKNSTQETLQSISRSMMANWGLLLQFVWPAKSYLACERKLATWHMKTLRLFN